MNEYEQKIKKVDARLEKIRQKLLDLPENQQHPWEKKRDAALDERLGLMELRDKELKTPPKKREAALTA